MGITGLLPILKPTLHKRHIRSFKNNRIGIDAFAWLYQILNYMAEELYLGHTTTKHVRMFESKLKHLIQNDIIPVVIFDGDSLIPKEKTNNERKVRKERYKSEIEILISKNMYSKAKELMKRCISVSKSIVNDITWLLKTMKVEYIIAPYEADAELCFLEKIGYIDCIMTEDSDLIPYGCQNILFKFDTSYVDHYTIDCLQKAKDVTFKDHIQDICILSGCDYADSVPGVGICTAHKLIQKTKDIETVIDIIKRKKKIPENYLDNFNLAKTTFNHQIVYNPITKMRQYMTPIKTKYDYLGTLEDVKYCFILDNADNGIVSKKKEVVVDRHFVPILSKDDITLRPIDDSDAIKIDNRLTSPYFDTQ